MTLTVTATWLAACRLADLLPERGAAALFGAVQVAVFRLHDDSVHAIGNRDPFSGAHVLSRGIVGTRGDTPIVVSPMHKQAFDLHTGQCLDDAAVRVAVYPTRVRGGLVEVRVGP